MIVRAAAVALVVIVAGCSSSGGGGGPADALVACLKKADVPAAADSDVPLGVKDSVHHVRVAPLPAATKDDPSFGSESQGVDLWVFDDAATAKRNRAAITLSTTDTKTGRVTGRIVVRYFYPPAASNASVTAIDACVSADS